VLPLPTLLAPREQRLRAALHENRWANVRLLLMMTDLDVSALDGTRPRRPNLRRPEHAIRPPQVGRLHRGRILGTALEPTDRRVNHPGSDGDSVLSGGWRDGPIYEAPS
jgi:hypothetical protein